MKKIIFPAVSVIVSGICVICSHKILGNNVRASNTFYFLPHLTSGQPLLSDLTNTFNWTTISGIGGVVCVGTSYVCTVTPYSAANIQNRAQLADAIRTAQSIPSTYTVIKRHY